MSMFQGVRLHELKLCHKRLTAGVCSKCALHNQQQQPRKCSVGICVSIMFDTYILQHGNATVFLLTFQ